MKRISAFVLAMVMLFALIPMGITTDAAAIDVEPFYCINMSETNPDMPYTYWMPFFYAYDMDENTQWPRVSCYGTSDQGELALRLKEDFNNRPKGSRYFQLCIVATAFYGMVEEYVYFDRAVELTKDWVTDFLEIYKGIGGELDGIIVDLEYHHSHENYFKEYLIDTKISATQTTDAYIRPGDPAILDRIVEHESYDKLRAMLDECGFQFYEGTDHSELWSVQRYTHRVYNGLTLQGTYSNPNFVSANASIWNHVMDVMERESINEAVLDPLLEYYPDAIVSDYQSGSYDAWDKGMDGIGALERFNIQGAGNAANYNAYYGKGIHLSNPPASYNDAVYEHTPFNSSLFDINLFKNIYAASDTGIMNAWIAEYWYSKESGVYSGTPYYTETIYHVGLLDPQPFLGFAIDYSIKDKGYDYNTCMQIISDIMAELTRVAGTSDRKPIQTPASWNGSYILSGMYAGGRNIWRLTPDTNVVSLKDFKVEGSVPTFSVDGLTITFPNGRIIEDTTIDIAGSCGYWIETPADVTPVITSTADRYKDNPSFGMDFDKYTVGAAALPSSYWTVSGTANVVENGSGKALALVGNSSITNTTAPQYVTAGDNYAKQQAWEVTFTLPSDWGSDDELVLLSSSTSDGGIKIVGNQIYYSHNGRYYASGTINPGTYTLRRDIDFTTAGAFSYDASLYDADGNYLSRLVTKAAIKSFTLPATQVIVASTANTTATVLIDNYKLYQTGVTTVFELFDGKIGTKLTDTTVTRDKDTGYRLSWMNASSTHKEAIIYAGDIEVIRIPMPAGMDGVAADLVQVRDYGEHQLRVEVVDFAYVTPEIGTNTTWPTMQDNMNTLDWADVFLPYFGVEMKAIEGEAAQYYVVADGMLTSEGANASNYIIKLEYPADGVPVLTLKDADLAVQDQNAIVIGKEIVDDLGNATIDNDFPLVINLVGENTINIGAENDGGTAIKILTTMPVTITGSGSLNATTNDGCVIESNAELFIKDTTFTGEAYSAFGDPSAYAIFTNAKDITIDNSNVELISHAGSALNVVDAISGKFRGFDIIVKNGSDLTVTCNADEYPAIYCGGSFIINDSSVEITSNGDYCFGSAPSMAGVHAVAGADANSATKFVAENAPTYSYFKADSHTEVVDKGYPATCTTTGLTEGIHCSVCNEVIIKQTVIAATGHTGNGYVVENEVEATETTDGSYDKVQYCIACGCEMSRESVVVSAETTTKRAWLRMPTNDGSEDGTTFSVTVNEGETKYYVTDENGWVASTNNTENYNIKLDYPTGGDFTIYLKGAYIHTTLWTVLTIGRTGYTGSADIVDFRTTIVVEEDSTIYAEYDTDNKDDQGNFLSSYSAIGNNTLHPMTITGNGKLTAISEGATAIGSGKGVIIQDANVVAKGSTVTNSASALSCGGSGVLIDNSTVELSSRDGAAVITTVASADLIIRNGSKVTASSNTNGSVVRPSGNFVISESSVIVLRGNDLSGSRCFTKIPTMVGVTAIAGSSAQTARPFEAIKLPGYTYFETVICEHTGGTADCELKAVCEICGMSYGELGHVPEADDGDCTTDVKCALCGDVAIEGNLSHTEVVDPRVEPNCTETGLTEGSHCSVCNTVLVTQEIISATGHSYETEVIAPTCISVGYTKYTCHCGDTYNDDEVPATGIHTWDEGTVTTAPTDKKTGIMTYGCIHCDETKTEVMPVCFYGTAVEMANSLNMYFAFRTSHVADTGYVVFVRKFADDRADEITEVNLSEFVVDNGFYLITYNGICAKEMCDTVTVTVYDAEGNAVSESRTDSIRSYVMRILDKQDELTRRMLVDMLNYGAAAQTAFTYNTSDLANSLLTETQLAYGTQADPVCTNKLSASATGFQQRSAFDLQSNIYMNVQIFSRTKIAYVKVSYVDHYGNEKTETLTEDLNSSAVLYQYAMTGFVIADGRQDITWDFYSADDTLVVSVVDSMESYVARMATGNPWLLTMIKFCDSAYAYLHK